MGKKESDEERNNLLNNTRSGFWLFLFLLFCFRFRFALNFLVSESILLLRTQGTLAEPQDSDTQPLFQHGRSRSKIPGRMFQHWRGARLLEFFFGLWPAKSGTVAPIYHQTEQTLGQRAEGRERQHDGPFVFIDSPQQTGQRNFLGVCLAGPGAKTNAGTGLSRVFYGRVQTNKQPQQTPSVHDIVQSATPPDEWDRETNYCEPSALSRCQPISVYLWIDAHGLPSFPRQSETIQLFRLGRRLWCQGIWTLWTSRGKTKWLLFNLNCMMLCCL